MTNKFDRIQNFNVSVKEIGAKILFMRKLVPGGSEHSFGIHVAKLAGMPQQVLSRAELMLKELESSHNMSGKKQLKERVKEAVSSDSMQLSFFQLNDPVLEQIREELVAIDINTLTPVEALMKLNEIKKITGG
jgi:DNA mismatch repair protein MutS